jgi:hypothetical protein
MVWKINPVIMDTTSKEVIVGMRFIKDGNEFEVVECNPKIKDDWFCKSCKWDIGLWSYTANDILSGVIKSS